MDANKKLDSIQKGEHGIVHMAFLGRFDVAKAANVLISRSHEAFARGLNQYLESKRLDFPRFFFLSNDRGFLLCSAPIGASSPPFHAESSGA